MTPSFWSYFTDPILQAPTIGSILMCLSASLMGVLALVRRKALLGEALSHAAYPGVVLSMMGFYLFFPLADEWSFLAVLAGGFLFAYLGLYLIDKMVKKLKVSSDAALCFVLSGFFGLGLLLASSIQVSMAKIYKQIQFYIYGQTATMTDVHIVIYALLSGLIIGFILLFYRQLQVMLFHYEFAKSRGIKAKALDSAFFFLLVLSIIIGIRSVGIVLMSAMLIAPAVSARQFTNKLSTMLILSSIFGCFCGFLGNYSSVELSLWLNSMNPERTFSFPTGPMIALTGTVLACLSLLFAPKRGYLFRMARIGRFRYRCLGENLLKSLWKKGSMTVRDFKNAHSINKFFLHFLLFRLIREGWVQRQSGSYLLTKDGDAKAAQIIRLHRLWEVYLADHLGMGVEKVHRNAEDMEHIITPELEEKLNAFLAHPTKDPHSQPIPQKKEVL